MGGFSGKALSVEPDEERQADAEQIERDQAEMR